MSKFTLATFLFFNTVAFCQTPEESIDRFFSDYTSLGPIEALDNLYASMIYAERIQDDIDKLKMQFAGLTSIVGDYHGHDLIGKREVANRFNVYTYLIRYDRQPIRFTFKFYRPSQDWTLYAFSYDDNLSEEIEESLKMQYLLYGTDEN